MKDEELKFEEIETSHTLGGSVIHSLIRQGTDWIPITDTPVYMCDRGEGGRGEYGLRSVISTVIHT